MTQAQLMEAIVHAGLGAGPRGMQRVYRAIGIILGDYVEQPKTIDWPDGWAPDMADFRCGLDESTRLLTDHDRRAIEEWYARTIGEVPRWVTWLAAHDPTSLKAYRRAQGAHVPWRATHADDAVPVDSPHHGDGRS